MQPAPTTQETAKPIKVSKSKNLGSPARVIISTIVIFLISQTVAILILQIGVSILQPGSATNLDSSAIDQFVYIFIAELLAAWLAIMIVRRRGLSLGFIGLGRRPQISDLGKGAIGFVSFFAVLLVVSFVVSQFSPDFVNQKQDVGFTNLSNNSDQLLAFLALVILPPIGEEILVRGYLYSGLRKFWSFMPAMLVTSVFFGLAHLQVNDDSSVMWAAALDTFILSVVLVYLREKTGALYAGMMVHMLNNLLAFFVIIK